MVEHRQATSTGLCAPLPEPHPGRPKVSGHAGALHTASGTLAGETTVWRDVTDWIVDQQDRGWTVLGLDHDTDEASLIHDDGRTAHVAPRSH